MLKMRNALLFVTTVTMYMGLATAGSQSGINLYGKRYTNLDVDTILNSDRLVRNYVDCLLSRKPCSPEGKELKRLLPEALRTKCSKCTNYQKESALRVLKKLYSTYPEYYNDLREKWDPSGEYHRKFEQYLQEEQFNAISPDPTRPDVYQTSSNNVNTPSISLPGAIPSSTYRTTLETQRPARNGEQPTVSLTNRFADDDDDIRTGPVAVPAAPPAPNDPGTASYLPPSAYIPSRSSSSSSSSGTSSDSPPITATATATTARPARTTVAQSVSDASSSTAIGSNQQPATASSIRTTSVVAANDAAAAGASIASVGSSTRAPPNIIQVLFPSNNNAPNPFQPSIGGSISISGNGPFGLGIIKSIGNKISNTAEFFAEMVRNTVKRP